MHPDDAACCGGCRLWRAGQKGGVGTVALVSFGLALAACNFALRFWKLRRRGAPLVIRHVAPTVYLGALIFFAGSGALMIAKEASAKDSLRPFWLIAGGLAVGIAVVVGGTWLSAHRSAG